MPRSHGASVVYHAGTRPNRRFETPASLSGRGTQSGRKPSRVERRATRSLFSAHVPTTLAAYGAGSYKVGIPAMSRGYSIRYFAPPPSPDGTNNPNTPVIEVKSTVVSPSVGNPENEPPDRK